MRNPSSVAKVALLLLLVATATDSRTHAQAKAKAGTDTQAKAPAPPPVKFHLIESSIDDVHAALRSKQTTCRALMNMYLRRIFAYDKTGSRLNAIQAINPHGMEEADRLDAAFEVSGFVGPLHCIPVLVKDEVEVTDMPTTYGSAVFRDFVSVRDATIVTKLKKAGAIILGKSTMGELASGYLSSASGPIRNPYDLERHASGSSGGSGAGVATNFATVAIGEDTGGSTRGPAAVSSLVGLRPTTPLVSRHGSMPVRPSADTLGPITKTVKDAATVLEVIAGYDSADPATAGARGQIPKSYTAFLVKTGLKGARLGIIRQPMDVRTDTTSDDYLKVKAVIDKAISDLKAQGAEVIDPITIPDLIDRVKKSYDANVFETEPAINKYLAELSNAPARTLEEILMSGKVVPSRGRALTNTLGKSTADPGYQLVQTTAESTRKVVLALMAEQKLDALVYATFDHQPETIKQDDMTNPAVDTSGIGNNRRLSPVLGFPALTVPAGFTSDGLPVGIEFLGKPFAEGTLFKLGYAYEQATHNRKPPKFAPPIYGEQ